MIRISVDVMRTSAGADYFVMIRNEDREISAFCSKMRYQAEYTADEYRHVLLGESEPDMLAYDETTYPNLYEPMTEEEILAAQGAEEEDEMPNECQEDETGYCGFIHCMRLNTFGECPMKGE